MRLHFLALVFVWHATAAHAGVEGLQPLVQRATGVAGFDFSPDGRWMVSHGRNDLHVWDFRQGRVVRQVNMKLPVGQARFGPDSRTLYYSQDTELWRYDLFTNTQTKTAISTTKELAFGMTQDRQRAIVFTLRDPRIPPVFYDLATERKSAETSFQNGYWSGVVLDAAGSHAAVTDYNYDTKVTTLAYIDLLSRKVLWTINDVTTIPLAFVGDGQLLVTRGERTLAFLSLQNGAVLRQKDVVGATARVFSIGVSHDGHFAALSGMDPTPFAKPSQERLIRMWDLTTFTELYRVGDPMEVQGGLAFSPDDTLLIGGHLNVWNRETGRLVRHSETEAGDYLRSLSMSADGRYVYVDGANDHVVNVIDLSTGERVFTDTDGGEMGVSHRGAHLIITKTVPGEIKTRLRIIEVGTWRTLFDGPRPDQGYMGMRSPSIDDMGQRFVTYDESMQGAMVYRLEGDKVRLEKHVNAPFGVFPAISNDGKYVLGREMATPNGFIAVNIDSGKATTFARSGVKDTLLMNSLYLAKEKRLVLVDTHGIASFDIESGRELKNVSFALPTDTIRTILTHDPVHNKLYMVAGNEVIEANATTLQIASRRVIDIDATGAVSAFDPLGHFLVTADPGRIDFRDPKTLDAKVRYLAPTADAGGWVTDQRYYSVTKNMLPRLHFVDAALRIYPFESFDLVFNRPDLVIEQLHRANPEAKKLYEQAWRRRVTRAGLTPERIKADAALPEIKLTSSVPPLEVTAPLLSLELDAKATSAPLDRLRVSVNEVPLSGSAGTRIEGNPMAHHARLEVPLTVGLNRISVSVRDAQGLESPAASIEVSYVGKAPPSRLIFVGIGVSKYRREEMSLAYAAKDAKDLAATLTAREGTSAQPATLLLDDKATRENVLAAKTLLSTTTVHDRVIVFIAGHGLLGDKLDYWFATTDTNFDKPEGTGVSYDEIETLLDGIPARHKLLLMDTCFSGELDEEQRSSLERDTKTAAAGMKLATRAFRGLKKKNSAKTAPKSSQLLRGLFADLQRGSGAIVIASAGGAEFALESETFKNGVFTYALIEALARAKKLSVAAIERSVGERVLELTKGAQRPSARRELTTSDFDL